MQRRRGCKDEDEDEQTQSPTHWHAIFNHVARLSYSFPPLSPSLVYKAYNLMWELKEVFDPEFVLNPGVVLNRDPDIHIKNLKPSPVASPIVNR